MNIHPARSIPFDALIENLEAARERKPSLELSAQKRGYTSTSTRSLASMTARGMSTRF